MDQDEQSHDPLSDKVATMLADFVRDQLRGLRIRPERIPVFGSLIAQAPRAVTYRRDRVEEEREEFGDFKCDSIETLMQDLSRAEPMTVPRKQMVYGSFFPCHLLYPGWWVRSPDDTGLISGDWKGSELDVANIRHWLNFGFEQWGPSWDMWDPNEDNECLQGQIGYGDEANSLHVIIAPAAAKHLLDTMEGSLSVGVMAQGTLFHSSHDTAGLDKSVIQALNKPQQNGHPAMSYHLVISDFTQGSKKNNEDFITIAPEQPDVYSAYLWHCLIRKSDEFAGRRGTATLPSVIFTWEHTNLMSYDAVAFSHESLLFKKRNLEKRIGEELLILQHSYSVEGILRQRLDRPLVSTRSLGKVLGLTRDILSPRSRDRPKGHVVPLHGRDGAKNRNQ